MKEETSLDPAKLTFRFAYEIFLPEGLKGNMPFRGTLFFVAIPDLNFLVFEGKGAEVFTVEELKSRNDVSPVVNAVLKEFGE